MGESVMSFSPFVSSADLILWWPHSFNSLMHFPNGLVPYGHDETVMPVHMTLRKYS